MEGTARRRRVFADPARVNLRKAARATIVVPTVFGLLIVTAGDVAALFGAFGSFAALVFADFGGAHGARFGAYGGLLVVGGALVALGTGLADTMWPAVVATVVVVFAIALAGAFGGYFAAGTTSATLMFVLSIMSAAVEADLAARELGLAVGVVAAAFAALLLWPVHQRDRVRAAASTVLRAVAACLASPPADRDLRDARAAAHVLDDRAGTVYRPAGSITRERALVAIVIATRRLVPLVEDMTAADRSRTGDTLPEYSALASSTGATLDAAARVLAGDCTARIDVDALVGARDAHTRALERWTADTVGADGAERAIERFTAAFPLRRLSFAASQLATDATTAAHAARRSRRDSAAALARAKAVLRAHCNLRSVRFRNAARAALGLALAVLVAKMASVEHAFWVVLGALAVLRSNALGTGATALQALAGALLGFGIASALMVTVGGADTWLWIALPVVVFLAGYTPGAVNFVTGQAAFTVFVVVLFNVLVPEGWHTGLVRVQDVAIGAGISAVVGALLWPRGASGVARRTFAELLHGAGGHLRFALDTTLHDGAVADARAAGEAAADARARAVAALEDLVLEHGGGHVDRQAWGELLADATLLEVAADSIVRAGSVYGIAHGCGSARSSLEHEGLAVVAAIDREADQIASAGPSTASVLTSAPPNTCATPAALDECLAAHSRDGLEPALGLVWVHEWLALLGARARAELDADRRTA